MCNNPRLARYEGYGGWDGSDNQSRLLVQLSPEYRPGHDLTVANLSADTVVFDAENTRLDAQLQARDAQGQFYSNEIVGSVNPAQFWRRRGYSPGGLMDPYVD